MHRSGLKAIDDYRISLIKVRLWLMVLVLMLVYGCQESTSPSFVEQVRQQGELKVIIREGPGFFYYDQGRYQGLDYELLYRLAQKLGVTLKFYQANTIADIFYALDNRLVDLAVTRLSVTQQRKQSVKFTTPYLTSQSKVVYKAGTTRPRGLDELKGSLMVVAQTSHSEHLAAALEQYPDLTWSEHLTARSEQLMDKIVAQEIQYTVVDGIEFSLKRPYYPELNQAFALSDDDQIAWAVSRFDDSLVFYINAFFQTMERRGVLESLKQRYLDHFQSLTVGSIVNFNKNVDRRLERWRPLMEQYAQENDLDWRLLAAISYQESLWNPRARSPTGVRGLMMLTLNTAKEMNVTKRTDPEQSIRGGAQYISKLINRIDEEIEPSQRIYFALAAYNVGFGHLQDARTITKKRGYDGNDWFSVIKNLPLLRQKKWYKDTQFGYARGNEPVIYVQNIRRYYDILKWLYRPPSPQIETISRDKAQATTNSLPKAL